MGEECGPLRTLQTTTFWPDRPIGHTQMREWNAWNPLEWRDYPIKARRLDRKEKRYQTMDVSIPGEHRVGVKENEYINKYLDLVK